jgi:proteasome accessory factor C
LIDVWVTDDGAVDIRLAEYFERPLRLTPAEGVALVASARALLAVPGAGDGPLASAVEKLERVLGAVGLLQVDVGGAAHLDAIRTAIDEHEQIEIDYFSYSRDEMTTRSVDPERVFHALGAWYLSAYCHSAEGDRLFRVDRVRGVRPTGHGFAPRVGTGTADDRPSAEELGSLVYHPAPDDMRVTLRLAPEAEWVVETLPTETRRVERSGHVVVVLQVSGTAFLERLLLRLGPNVQVLDPPEAEAQRSLAAVRVLERYRSESAS